MNDGEIYLRDKKVDIWLEDGWREEEVERRRKEHIRRYIHKGKVERGLCKFGYFSEDEDFEDALRYR